MRVLQRRHALSLRARKLTGQQELSLLAFGLSGTVRDAVEGHATDITERLTVDDQHIDGMLIAYSDFREDDPGNDAAHWVKGSVSLVWDEVNDKHYIQLENNFEAGLAPDLYIYCLLYTSPSPRDS